MSDCVKFNEWHFFDWQFQHKIVLRYNHNNCQTIFFCSLNLQNPHKTYKIFNRITIASVVAFDGNRFKYNTIKLDYFEVSQKWRIKERSLYYLKWKSDTITAYLKVQTTRKRKFNSFFSQHLNSCANKQVAWVKIWIVFSTFQFNYVHALRLWTIIIELLILDTKTSIKISNYGWLRQNSLIRFNWKIKMKNSSLLLMVSMSNMKRNVKYLHKILIFVKNKVLEEYGFLTTSFSEIFLTYFFMTRSHWLLIVSKKSCLLNHLSLKWHLEWEQNIHFYCFAQGLIKSSI